MNCLSVRPLGLPLFYLMSPLDLVGLLLPEPWAKFLLVSKTGWNVAF